MVVLLGRRANYLLLGVPTFQEIHKYKKIACANLLTQLNVERESRSAQLLNDGTCERLRIKTPLSIINQKIVSQVADSRKVKTESLIELKGLSNYYVVLEFAKATHIPLHLMAVPDNYPPP